MCSSIRALFKACFFLAVALTSLPASSALFSATGATAADITPTVDAFRDALGTLNPNLPQSFPGGRREINWDGVPPAFSSPNAFPGDFFNQPVAGRARGAVFSTPGTGFEVSADQFSNINVDFPSVFEPFSNPRLFTAIGSGIVDVTFFLPGTNTPATTKGFGAVFSDVDLANNTTISYYDANNNLLGTAVPVEATAGVETFSFLGATFDDAIVRRVRIANGSIQLSPDFVTMDDFIYGEPVPEPSTWLLVAVGLSALVWLRKTQAV